jgi:hypothetical protein
VSLIVSGIRLVSTVACIVIALSFGLFVIDKAKGGEQTQIGKLNGTTQQRHDRRSTFRRDVDDVSNALTSPFKEVVHSSSAWTKHVVIFLLGFLLWGVLLRFVAGYLPARR